jgi:hypothetical protein
MEVLRRRKRDNQHGARRGSEGTRGCNGEKEDVPFSTPNTPATACFSKNHTLMTLKIWMPLPDMYIMKAEGEEGEKEVVRGKKKGENGQHRSRGTGEARGVPCIGTFLAGASASSHAFCCRNASKLAGLMSAVAFFDALYERR